MARNGLRRFVIFAAAVTLVAGAAAVTTAAPEPAVAAAVELTPPAPTGSHPVGVTEVHFVDAGRVDPWAGGDRELMVQIWYPAEDSGSSEPAVWMPAGGREAQRDYLDGLGVPARSWRLGPSHSYPNRPARQGIGRFPVLLNSPGMTDTTGWSTAQAEDLASHGYVVVAMNHTHEAFAVHFPDGRVERTVVPLDSPPEVLSDVLLPNRVADTRFVLAELADAAAGGPTAAALPAELAANLDLTRVGMFGHSLGGSTTVQALHDEPGIRAGVNLDGPVLGSVADEGTDKPLLMLAGGRSPWYGQPGWEPFWSNNIGVKLPIGIAGTEHMSFCDQQVILPVLAAAGLLGAEAAGDAVGDIDARRSVDLQRTYLRTFFDTVFAREGGDILRAITLLAQPEVVPHG
ncbi:hypothetical protein [Nocardia sp. NPDC057668]|uniref:alpha/beta hydrolase n=1 Tax=Nocardia sp. NPDC057668 TaxID=3346202 RepID=UPI003672BE55